MVYVRKSFLKRIFRHAGLKCEIRCAGLQTSVDNEVVDAWPEDCGNSAARSGGRVDTPSVDL